jgi:hypothetical protein
MVKDDDLTECAHVMIKRHGVSAQNIARMFAHTHLSAGNKGMAAYWITVSEAIDREITTAVH